MPNASLNSVMELTTLTASNYQYLEDSWNTENFDSRINYSNDVADFGNEIVYDYNIMQQATYFLARIYIRNSYDTNEEYTDIPLDASLFIYDPVNIFFPIRFKSLAKSFNGSKSLFFGISLGCSIFNISINPLTKIICLLV